MKKRPQLRHAVLDRRASQQQAISAVEAEKSLPPQTGETENITFSHYLCRLSNTNTFTHTQLHSRVKLRPLLDHSMILVIVLSTVWTLFLEVMNTQKLHKQKVRHSDLISHLFALFIA